MELKECGKSKADGHLPCALITFGARLAASEIAISNLLDMRFRFTLFPFPLAVSVHTQQKEESQRESERGEGNFCCYRNLCVSDFHGLTCDLGKRNAEDRGANGDRQKDKERKREEDRQWQRERGRKTGKQMLKLLLKLGCKMGMETEPNPSTAGSRHVSHNSSRMRVPVRGQVAKLPGLRQAASCHLLLLKWQHTAYGLAKEVEAEGEGGVPATSLLQMI